MPQFRGQEFESIWYNQRDCTYELRDNYDRVVYRIADYAIHNFPELKRIYSSGQHRRTSTTTHSNPPDRAGNGPGGPRWVSYGVPNTPGLTIDAIYSAMLALRAARYSEPEPSAPIPYAGIRTGEIIGHRLWWLIAGRLCSLMSVFWWQPGETVKGDLQQIVVPAELRGGDPPIYGGVYSYRDADQLTSEKRDKVMMLFSKLRMQTNYPVTAVVGSRHPLYYATGLVSGTIKCWGEVIEHEKGWRAEFAKLNTIDEVYGGDINELREKYRVP